jgi:hypothetical protein
MGFSDWLQTAEGTLAIVSVGLNIVFYLKARHIKQPIYAIRSAHLVRDVSDRVDLLEIKYAGQRIPNLTSSRIALWNQGKETIQGSDIAEADPLSIRIGQA